LVLQRINGVSSNPVEGRTNIWQLKDLILTLFGLIYIYPSEKEYIYIHLKIKPNNGPVRFCNERSCDRRTPNKPHKRMTRRAVKMAGIGWLAAVAYVSMELIDSPDDEEGSIAYLFESVFKK
jgi:hypothetical protein